LIASRVVTMPLPHGRDWLYYSDLNLLALAPHLDAAGRQRCAEELAIEWRREMRRRLAVVPADLAPCPPTTPIPTPARSVAPLVDGEVSVV